VADVRVHAGDVSKLSQMSEWHTEKVKLIYPFTQITDTFVFVFISLTIMQIFSLFIPFLFC